MRKILVVETSPTIISVADSLLRQKGYDVTCLANGEEGFNYAKKEQPDLIISGLGLPGINGIELCKKVATDSMTGGIPVVLLVGEQDGIFLDQLEVCGARGRLKKPFSPKELLSIVEKYGGVGTSMHITRIVDQNAEGVPHLQASATGKIEPQVGFPKNIKPQDEKNGAPFSLGWDDLKETGEIKSESVSKLNLDDTGLVLDDDQYGLTSFSDPGATAQRKRAQEDYNWFVDEMKRDIAGSGESQPAKTTKTPADDKAINKPAAPMTYQDLGKPISDDEAKYKRFLEQFKKDTGGIAGSSPLPISQDELNWLAEAVSDKLARKIVAQIDKEELKQIIASVLVAAKK